MKSRLVLTAVVASLVAVGGLASAQETYRTAQPPMQGADTTGQSSMTQPGMQQDANAPGQPADSSAYGGTPSTRSAAGMVSKPCVRGPGCDIFFGQ
ncbi:MULTISPECIES: hypothetical protein [Caballeronia]|uniref:Lipoprotein n=1 Tax=Caballeronia telluris TaxID=326475 RepID=A0A158J3B8_9BURK|nr:MULTISPECIES: hypothetical protein [Caballeronia]MDR5751944.1 hypothetical protein [Caballeronia sp. LZ024]MDR5843915.1 hypothetical protein [Caballeronia sp. LZ031]SAL63442.1 hypothetical protein AWB66_03774 [Caballeronia telluris]